MSSAEPTPPSHHCKYPFVRGHWKCPDCGAEYYIDHDPTKTNFMVQPLDKEHGDA